MHLLCWYLVVAYEPGPSLEVPDSCWVVVLQPEIIATRLENRALMKRKCEILTES